MVSHWLLDFATHRADMPVFPGGRRYGLGLWNSVPATLAIESALFAVGVAMYARATRPKDGIGRYGLVGLVLVLVVAYLGAAFGPTPPSVGVVVGTGMAGGVLLIVLSAWVDRHRRPAG